MKPYRPILPSRFIYEAIFIGLSMKPILLTTPVAFLGRSCPVVCNLYHSKFNIYPCAHTYCFTNGLIVLLAQCLIMEIKGFSLNDGMDLWCILFGEFGTLLKCFKDQQQGQHFVVPNMGNARNISF